MVKLDKKDYCLISQLDFNARTTLTKLGKRIRLSKQAINKRMSKLEKEQIIEGYYTIINIAKLGLTAYRLALKFQNFTSDDEADLFVYCRSLSGVGWLFSVNGKWDVVITIYAENIVKFNEIAQKILYKYNHKILENNISVVISIYTYPNKFLADKNPKVIVTGGNISLARIDRLDKEILKLLNNNSRLSLVQLSDKLKQNPRTINNRISKLEKNGIIQGYRAKVNTSLLGYTHYKVFLNLKNMTERIMRSMLQYFFVEKQIVYSTLAIGLADIEFEAKLKSPEELYQLINKIRNEFKDNIKSSDSVIIRKEQFIEYYPFK